MRILITGEPSAGNLSSIIAVTEAIDKITKNKNNENDDFDFNEFLVISSKCHFLREIIGEEKIPYKIISSPKSKKIFSIQSIIDIFRTAVGFFQSMVYVFDFMPDAIFSKGGFVSLPIVFWGWVFRIPIVIHESDMIAAGIDKFMFFFAKKVAVSFDKSLEIYKSPKVFFTGHPIREFITRGNKEKVLKELNLSEDIPIIFVIGRSEGEDEINDLVLDMLYDLLKKYQVIHQCGIQNYDKIKSKVDSINIPNLNRYHLFPFLRKKIADVYSACDLVISKAGEGVISEIMAVGKPSILIPLPQYGSRKNKNAFYYSKAGAAVLANERNLKPRLLMSIINEIFKNDLKIIEIKRAARKMSSPDAARKIAKEIASVAK